MRKKFCHILHCYILNEFLEKQWALRAGWYSNNSLNSGWCKRPYIWNRSLNWYHIIPEIFSKAKMLKSMNWCLWGMNSIAAQVQGVQTAWSRYTLRQKRAESARWAGGADTCLSLQHKYLLKLKVMYTVGYSSSLVMLLVALSILCAFRWEHTSSSSSPQASQYIDFASLLTARSERKVWVGHFVIPWSKAYLRQKFLHSFIHSIPTEHY